MFLVKNKRKQITNQNKGRIEKLITLMLSDSNGQCQTKSGLALTPRFSFSILIYWHNFHKETI
jgi:hypothetical protein